MAERHNVHNKKIGGILIENVIKSDGQSIL
jgi:biotin-(acetyl-CoA carboxylase) ligase